jgi:hypothetical protein
MDADPVDTSYTRDCMSLVRAGVINGMSFGFNVVKDAWYDDEGNPSDRMNGTRRELLEGQLIEGSPVTRPAYGGTAISARDEANALIEARQRAAGQPADADEERAPKPYGDVPYADPKNGKYPIDKAHVKAAWAYINQAKNAAKYPLNGVSLKSVKDRIRKAMVKFGFTSGTAAEAKFEFANPEWRDDDPYLDDWYELDDIADEKAEAEEAKSEGAYPNLVAAILAHRDEAAVREAIDYCITLRDDPDGKEYAAIDTALQHLRKSPPDVKSALSTLRKYQGTGQRDDPDGQEYAAIDRACRLLEEEPPDVKGAKNVLAGNQMWRRDQDGEPDTSTPEDEDESALLASAAQRRQDSRELGYI